MTSMVLMQAVKSKAKSKLKLAKAHEIATKMQKNLACNPDLRLLSVPQVVSHDLL